MTSSPDELRFSPDPPEPINAYQQPLNGLPHPRLHERARQGRALFVHPASWATMPPHMSTLRPVAATGRRDVGTLSEPSFVRCVMEIQLGRHAIPTTVDVSTVLPSAVGSFLIAEDSTVLHPVRAGTTVATERGEETIVG